MLLSKLLSTFHNPDVSNQAHNVSNALPCSHSLATGSHLQTENLLNLDDDVECDEPLVPLTDAQVLRELKKEVLDVCQQMKTLTERSRGAQNSLNSLDTNSSDDVPLHKVKVRRWDEVQTDIEAAITRITVVHNTYIPAPR